MLVARERFNYQELPLRDSYKRLQTKRVRKVSTKTKVVYCTVVLIALCLAFLVTSRYAQIASLGYEIIGLQKQAQAVDSENQILENKIAELKSLQNIEYVAVTKLGMEKPELAEGVQFVPVEYTKAGYKDDILGVAAEDGAGNNPKPKEKKNFLVQTLAKIING